MKLFYIVILATLTACGGGGSSSDKVPTQSGVTCSPVVVNVAMRGDSTMERMGNRVQVLMDQHFGVGAVVVTNYGVSGTMAYEAPTITTADVSVANYGINDMRDGTDTADTFYTRMSLMDLTIVETQSPQVWGKGYEAGFTAASFNEEDFVDAARRLGVTSRIPIADTYSYVKSLPNWQDYIEDGVHPNAALMDLIAQNVLAPAIAAQVEPLRCLR